ncbi:MAG: phosphodiester glycosidase family protein [Lachnospiraceae bacterium]|nr:phosphodiester glycosidase family protein [Lachnospiraceae bacterium]
MNNNNNNNNEPDIVSFEDFHNDKPFVTKKKTKSRREKLRGHLIRTAVTISVLFIMYLTFVFSSIPFIAKWRTIYIETAMTTNSHQWLATWFFPDYIIAEVMLKYNQGKEAQKDLASSWGNVDDIIDSTDDLEFFQRFWELKSDSFSNYIQKHKDLVKDGYDKLVIEDLEGKLKLKTAEDDALLVVDIPNNLLIIGVKGSGYQGKMAIVKQPEQVIMAKSSSLGSFGQEIDSFCENNDAILGINASGFFDPKGESFGAEVKGCLVIDGVDYGSHHEEPAWRYFGVKKDNERMYITGYTPGMQEDYRWAMEFYPGLIIDGKSVVDGTYGMGIQPRTTVGQTKDGTMLLLVVDGRQTHSIGCTVEDCADIMMRYKAYQGMNLDGGSSSVMYYKGQFITKSSSVTGRGRYMPNAILVKAAKDVKIKKSSTEETIIKSQPAGAK